MLSGCGEGRVHLESPEPAVPARSVCQELLGALPARVADQPRREEDARWAAAWGDPPITLTCGVGEPTGFGPGSACTTVDGVDWYIPQSQLDSTVPVDLVLTSVYRKAHVRLELPKDYWPPATTLVDLADAVKTHDPPTGRCG